MPDPKQSNQKQQDGDLEEDDRMLQEQQDGEEIEPEVQGSKQGNKSDPSEEDQEMIEGDQETGKNRQSDNTRLEDEGIEGP